jgi:hypothetical protein
MSMSPMKRLLVALSAVLVSACASSGAVPRPFPVPGQPPEVIAPPSPAPAPPVGIEVARVDGYALAGTALGLRGVPYRNGGADPAGFDCSGFVQYVFLQHGRTMPRTVAQQFSAGGDAEGGVQPGDLVFFSTVAPGASHVGIAIGGDEFVHAPSSTGQVRVERMSSSYWSVRYVGARRVQ